MADANKYLEYLDKEMTIMGILSTFCVATVALVLDRVGAFDPAKEGLFKSLWNGQRLFVLLGSGCVVLAAALFYMQRSALAWFYGQISLSIEDPSINGLSTEDWYRDADSWATWIPYQSGFTALSVGAAFYAFAVLRASNLWSAPAWFLWTALAIGVPIQIGRMLIFRHYKFEDDPIGRFFGRER